MSFNGRELTSVRSAGTSDSGQPGNVRKWREASAKSICGIFRPLWSEDDASETGSTLRVGMRSSSSGEWESVIHDNVEFPSRCLFQHRGNRVIDVRLFELRPHVDAQERLVCLKRGPEIELKVRSTGISDENQSSLGP
jgi:hypothetical protein